MLNFSQRISDLSRFFNGLQKVCNCTSQLYIKQIDEGFNHRRPSLLQPFRLYYAADIINVFNNKNVALSEVAQKVWILFQQLKMFRNHTYYSLHIKPNEQYKYSPLSVQENFNLAIHLSEPIKNEVDAIIVNKKKNGNIPLLSSNAKPVTVPASRFGRSLSFGQLAVGLTMSTATSYIKSFILSDSNQNTSILITEANAERIVKTLCQVRGAALKIGQMLSIQDLSSFSPQIVAIFERVRQNADYMPEKQMYSVLQNELGMDWDKELTDFQPQPFAAASIGQVHSARLSKDGQLVAIKIQYPGVAKSIDSDINNLLMLLKYASMLPRGLYAEQAIEVAKRELKWECNYKREAQCAKKFSTLLCNDPVFKVPHVFEQFSTASILTAELIEGISLDKCFDFDQTTRNWLAEQMLRLCLQELFVFHFMQTDPNWSNFFYKPDEGKIVLLDFGASRRFSKRFCNLYLRVIKASIERNVDDILRYSEAMGFLTGHESSSMRNAHVEAVMVLGEALGGDSYFDFSEQLTTTRVHQLIPLMLEHRLTPPPEETYSLHRKLAGTFLLCIRLGAKVNCRPLFDRIYYNYDFSEDNSETFDNDVIC